MSVSTPSKEQRAERHLMRVRGAGKIARAISQDLFAFTIAAKPVAAKASYSDGRSSPIKKRKLDHEGNSCSAASTSAPGPTLESSSKTPEHVTQRIKVPATCPAKIDLKARARQAAKRLFDDSQQHDGRLPGDRIVIKATADSTTTNPDVKVTSSITAKTSTVRSKDMVIAALSQTRSEILVRPDTQMSCVQHSESTSEALSNVSSGGIPKAVSSASILRKEDILVSAPSEDGKSRARSRKVAKSFVPNTLPNLRPRAPTTKRAQAEQSGPTTAPIVESTEELSSKIAKDTSTLSAEDAGPAKALPSTSTKKPSKVSSGPASKRPSPERATKSSRKKIDQPHLEDDMEALPPIRSSMDLLKKPASAPRKVLAGISTNRTVTNTSSRPSKQNSKSIITNPLEIKSFEVLDHQRKSTKQLQIFETTRQQSGNDSSMLMSTIEPCFNQHNRLALLAATQGLIKPNRLPTVTAARTQPHMSSRKRFLAPADDDDVDLDDLIMNITTLTKGVEKHAPLHSTNTTTKRQKRT